MTRFGGRKKLHIFFQETLKIIIFNDRPKIINITSFIGSENGMHRTNFVKLQEIISLKLDWNSRKKLLYKVRKLLGAMFQRAPKETGANGQL